MVAQQFPIEAGHVQRFRRAVGDPAADRSDVAVPPTFTVANVEFDPDWWLRPREGQIWFGSGRSAGTPGTGRGLHAEQHFIYHRPARVGETLSGTTRPGESWEKQGRRGTLQFSEEITEWRDDAGDLVISERRVRVLTQGAPAKSP